MLAESTIKNMFAEIIYDYVQGSNYHDVYLGVFSLISGDNFVEPTDSSYKRSLLSGRLGNTVKNWNFTYTRDDGTGKSKLVATNANEIHLPETTQAWETISSFGIFDSQTGGTPRYWGSLKTSITPAAKTVVVIKEGALSITIEG